MKCGGLISRCFPQPSRKSGHERKKEEVFDCTRCITPKSIASFAGHIYALLSKKCRSGGKPLATLRSIRPGRDMNLQPPAPEAKDLPLDQLASYNVKVQ